MKFRESRTALRTALFGAAAVAAMAPALAAAQESDRPTTAIDAAEVVGRNGLEPQQGGPNGLLDYANPRDVTGVGQMYLRTNQVSTGGFVCSGTLINPRTVLFAAHCVNSDPMQNLGFANGGKALSFGFEGDNLAAVRLWLGLASAPGAGDANPARFQNQSNPDRHLYNVEQVWYDTRSLTPASRGFLQADIAVATLDTPATNVPTWALLFSALTEETHGTINGYGVTSLTNQGGTTGANAGGSDFRRRAAENMISFLGSLDERDTFLFCPEPPATAPNCPRTALPQAVYQIDFDDPLGQGIGFNFDLFDGPALAREGTTSGGNSGGPLIVDQKYSEKVVAGVLSFGSRFFTAQPGSSYGTSSGYQPLFLYWDEIVTQNPYIYATNQAGKRDWTDPTHWVQQMDPAYRVDRNGQLVNALPGELGRDLSLNTTRFGKVCFLDDCQDITNDIRQNEGTGAGLVIPDGPGSTNFVPNNTRGTPNQDPALNRKARYYDVTLAASGETRVTTAITVDKLTLNGSHTLDIKAAAGGGEQSLAASGGALTVLGDFTQLKGTTNVDGSLTTGDAIFLRGTLAGSGLFDPTFLTVVDAIVAPGGLSKYGTLTVQGDVILSSASRTVIELNRNRTDLLAVTADDDNDGEALLNGALYVLRGSGNFPRAGQSYTVLTAAGGIDGTFAEVVSGLGSLRAEASYGENDVVVNLVAGSLAQTLGKAGAAEMSFANALDAARASSYNSLYGLYGAIDLMYGAELAMTLGNLAPRISNEATALHDRQASIVTDLVTDRLSMLGTKANRGGTLAVLGSPETLVPGMVYSGSSAAQRSFVNSIVAERTMGALPANMSGFVSGGYQLGRAALTDANNTNDTQRSWHMAMGLEMEVSDRATLGTAFGFASGTSRLTGSEAETDTSQAAVYGSYRLGGGFYAAGLAAMAQSRIGVQRSTTTGLESFSLRGDTTARTINVKAEAGVNLPVFKSMTLTPKASVGYVSYNLSGFREAGGELALQIDDYSQSRVEGRMGFAFSGATGSAGGWQFAPQLTAEWVQAFDAGRNEMQVRFAAAPAEAFLLPGYGFDRSYGEVKGGLKLSKGDVSFGAAAQTSISRSDFRDNRAVADFTLRF